jgi:hypothetical protein
MVLVLDRAVDNPWSKAPPAFVILPVLNTETAVRTALLFAQLSWALVRAHVVTSP